jgi:hypothetical protein
MERDPSATAFLATEGSSTATGLDAEVGFGAITLMDFDPEAIFGTAIELRLPTATKDGMDTCYNFQVYINICPRF